MMIAPMPTVDFGERAPATVSSLAAGSFTEAWAAGRLAAENADRLRFDFARNRWLIRQPHHWAPDNSGGVIRVAIQTVRDWQRLALDIPDVRARGRVLDFALSLERRAKLEAVLGLARCVKPLADDGKGWDADKLTLGTPSSVVDLRTGQGRAGRPADRITMQTAVGFDPAAQCPRWEQAMHEWFPDPDLSEYVRLALGYSVSGSTDDQVLFACHNGGAGGKSTMLAAVAHALGDYSYNLPFSVIELQQRSAIPNDLAALNGRRFILASETNDGTRLNEGRLKSLTGGDACTARFLHGEYFTFQPVGKFWLAFNHKPVVRDDSFAFWRRVRLIPFVRTFASDPTLAATLRGEAAGILKWLVTGCLDWQRHGLSAPAIVTEATQDYQADSDVLARFLDEACEINPGSEVAANDFYQHYVQWAERAGFTTRDRLSSTAFGRKLAERFRKVKTRSGALYIGIGRG